MLMFIFMQKTIFTPHLFLEILQKYCKLVILGTLNQPVENSDVYLETKAQLEPSFFLQILLHLLQILQSRTFWAETPEQEFCQTWV